jgi:hypothetical protein
MISFQFPPTRTKAVIRLSGSVLAIAMTATIIAGPTLAADMEIPPPPATKEISVQKGPPYCSRWTDDCVSCARGGNGAPPVCSNTGFSCQPKSVRCLEP